MLKSAVNESKHLCENMSFSAHEAYKRLRTNTILALPQKDKNIIGITSAQPREGKSTSTINLAYSFAELGKKVLLIDADLHRPSVGEKLNLTWKFGLSSLLTDSNDISSAILHYKPGLNQVSFDIICDKTVENTSEILSSPRFPSLLRALINVYDYILIDLPPIDAVIDAVIVGKHTDGMIVIAKENETPKKQFDNCIRQLEFAGIKILGVVFNGSFEGVGKKYQYRYQY